MQSDIEGGGFKNIGCKPNCFIMSQQELEVLTNVVAGWQTEVFG